MSVDVRRCVCGDVAELYVTAGGDASVYEQVAQTLRSAEAHIIQERLFAPAEITPAALARRSQAYGRLDDGVTPTLLNVAVADGPVGVQVHAIRGLPAPRIIRSGQAVGRLYESDGCRYLSASGLQRPALANAPTQAHATFAAVDELIRAAGGRLADLARTWIWMDRILDWYGDLNRVRTAFFTERHLLNGSGNMPASTGIGVSPAAGRVALDAFAAWGSPDIVERFSAIGHQRSAYEYGSAFARAARVRTPGGATIYCSGTAAIDPAGKTCHVGDIAGQVDMTLDNVRAVLGDLGCDDGQVVQAMAYCTTPAVRDFFLHERRPGLPWPCLTMLGDVCRSDLLFEIEVTACTSDPRARAAARCWRPRAT